MSFAQAMVEQMWKIIIACKNKPILTYYEMGKWGQIWFYCVRKSIRHWTEGRQIVAYPIDDKLDDIFPLHSTHTKLHMSH